MKFRAKIIIIFTALIIGIAFVRFPRTADASSGAADRICVSAITQSSSSSSLVKTGFPFVSGVGYVGDCPPAASIKITHSTIKAVGDFIIGAALGGSLGYVMAKQRKSKK